MRRYGGLTANDSEVKNCEVIDDYKYEYMGEYKYLLETFFNEVWNRAEEYQKMFKETVQVRDSMSFCEFFFLTLQKVGI